MSFKSLTLAAAAAFALTSPAFAESKIMIKDAYARGSLKVGAAFLEIHNQQILRSRLLGATSVMSCSRIAACSVARWTCFQHPDH